ncbi:hypothetical protein EGK75_10080, partial [Neisseria weixii]
MQTCLKENCTSSSFDQQVAHFALAAVDQGVAAFLRNGVAVAQTGVDILIGDIKRLDIEFGQGK